MNTRANNRSGRLNGALFGLYLAFIFYASLFPLSDWRIPNDGLFSFLDLHARQTISRSDILTNVIAYIPMGIFTASWLRCRGRRFLSVAAPLVSGFALSFFVEAVQQFLPSRVPSLLDISLNGAGTLAGVWIASLFNLGGVDGDRLRRWRWEWFNPDRAADVSLAAVGVWMLSQLAPFVPSLDLGTIRHGIRPLWQTLLRPETFDTTKFSCYLLTVTALALLCSLAGRPQKRTVVLFFGMVCAVLFSKIFIMSRSLSCEAVLAVASAVWVVLPILFFPPVLRAFLAIGFVIATFTVSELVPGEPSSASGFLWIPFEAHFEHTLIGMSAILEMVWPAAALAALVRYATGADARSFIAIGGGAALTASVFALEWHQQSVGGRSGDITPVLLMFFTWSLCWSGFGSTASGRREREESSPAAVVSARG